LAIVVVDQSKHSESIQSNIRVAVASEASIIHDVNGLANLEKK
jgi:hypothetical protein